MSTMENAYCQRATENKYSCQKCNWACWVCPWLGNSNKEITNGTWKSKLWAAINYFFFSITHVTNNNTLLTNGNSEEMLLFVPSAMTDGIVCLPNTDWNILPFTSCCCHTLLYISSPSVKPCEIWNRDIWNHLNHFCSLCAGPALLYSIQPEWNTGRTHGANYVGCAVSNPSLFLPWRTHISNINHCVIA